MKKKLFDLLLVATAACAVVGFSACGKTEKSQSGGISANIAYAQAAGYGFDGTAEEFAAKVCAEVNSQNGVYIQKVELTDDGELIITYTDGSKKSLGYVQCAHAYSEWELSLQPTCSSIGYNTRTCAKCNDIDYDFLQPLGHTANEFTQITQSSHTYYCTECGANVHELHDLKDGECTVCDYELDYTLGLRYVFMQDTQSYKVTGTLADSPAREAKEIIIPSIYNDYPVAEIGESAFYGRRHASLEKIVIPKSVTVIDRSAFSNSIVKEVIIPDSVLSIGDLAFADCDNLENMRLPSRLKEVGYFAFYNCISLQSIVIPDSVEELNDTFAGCTSLKNAQLSKGIKTVS